MRLVRLWGTRRERQRGSRCSTEFKCPKKVLFGPATVPLNTAHLGLVGQHIIFDFDRRLGANAVEPYKVRRHGNMALIRLSGRCDRTLIAPLGLCICARRGRSAGRTSPSQRHSVACGLVGWQFITWHNHYGDRGKVRKPGHAAAKRNGDDAAGAAGCRGMHVMCLD